MPRQSNRVARKYPFDITLPSATLSYSVRCHHCRNLTHGSCPPCGLKSRQSTLHGAVIAAGVGGLVAETVCGRLQSLRLPDDEMVQGCVLLPDAVETTSDAARAHGQRTFDEGNGGDAGLRQLGWIVHEAQRGVAANTGVASDVIVSFPGRPARDAAPSSSIRLPQTGYGTGGHHSFGRQLPTLLLGAARRSPCAAPPLSAHTGLSALGRNCGHVFSAVPLKQRYVLALTPRCTKAAGRD